MLLSIYRNAEKEEMGSNKKYKQTLLFFLGKNKSNRLIKDVLFGMKNLIKSLFESK